ncbi:MAG: sulfatase [Spirochaetaceae bacterium]
MTQDRPNIIFIMSDDHAAQAISAYGSRINETPNLDRLVSGSGGVRFDNCYVTNSICTPSRAAILTGTYNHVNRVTTLDTHIDNRLPNVAKHLQTAGYETGIVGKWHLGEGAAHEPTGFSFWKVLPGQGDYYDPSFHTPDGVVTEEGYVTDIITKECISFMERRDVEKPFFLMCHHKAPHRPWDPKAEHRDKYLERPQVPESFDDDYRNRARAAEAAKMRIAEDMTYDDLDLLQLPDSPGERLLGGERRKVPYPAEPEVGVLELRDRNTGEEFRFSSQAELKRFKYERYIRKYLQTVHSIDENVGRLLDYLDEAGLSDNTVVIYTSDQGFFLGEHGWFDKRFIYEESLRMPFLIRTPGTSGDAPPSRGDMICNVDFAPTFLELAGAPIPSYMQGRSIVPLLRGATPEDWPEEVYHRYWMNQDEVHNAYAHYGIRTHRYKLIYWYNQDCGEPGANPGTDRPEWELFDLERDPHELVNRYHDPAYAGTVRDMTRRLDRKMAELGDTPVHTV